jgi:hypothetical protein
VSANLGWQARLRWILRPGNDLFVVYLHNWHDDVVRRRRPLAAGHGGCSAFSLRSPSGSIGDSLVQ